METTDDSRQPLDITWSNRDDCSANASIVAGGVLAWLAVNRRAQSQWCCRVEVLTSTEHITAIGQRGHASAEDSKRDARKLYLHLTRDYGAMLDARDDLERRAIEAERERDEALGASDAIALRARAEVAAEKRVREQVTAERAVVFGDVKALRAVVQGVECKLADNIDSMVEASLVLRDLASSLRAFTGGGVSLAAAFKAVADLRRERDEAISTAARLFKQGEAAKNLGAAVRALLDLENT
jgi:hypothetical protein